MVMQRGLEPDSTKPETGCVDTDSSGCTDYRRYATYEVFKSSKHRMSYICMKQP